MPSSPPGPEADGNHGATSIHHVNIVIPHGTADAAVEFYRTLLAFEPIEKSARAGRPTGAWLRRGNLELHLSERDGSPHPDAHIAWTVDNLAVIEERAGSLGAPWEPAPVIVGTGRAFTTDPFGNRIELIELR